MLSAATLERAHRTTAVAAATCLDHPAPARQICDGPLAATRVAAVVHAGRPLHSLGQRRKLTEVVPASIAGMGKVSVVAGVVSFNPNLERLRENLDAAFREVDEIVVIDNNSKNREDIIKLVEEFPGLRVYQNGSNVGIAKALNQVMARASALNAAWVLLLDQDSVVSDGLVTALTDNIQPGVGIVAPAIVDRSDSQPAQAHGLCSNVDYCITSGSLCSIGAWESIGGYDEAMFIDFVDFDFCLRLRQSGLTIVRVPTTTLLHEIGKITRHGPFTAYHHSAFRSYHMARDMLYYAYKHRRSPRELMVQRRGLLGTYLVLARKAVIISLFEEDRVRRVLAILRGALTGTYALRRVA